MLGFRNRLYLTDDQILALDRAIHTQISRLNKAIREETDISIVEKYSNEVDLLDTILDAISKEN